jgi:hypothetical protein
MDAQVPPAFPQTHENPPILGGLDTYGTAEQAR